MSKITKLEFSKKYFVLADIDPKIGWNVEECIMSRYGNIENFVTRYTNYVIYMPGEGEFSQDYLTAKELEQSGQKIDFLTVEEFWNIVNATKLSYIGGEGIGDVKVGDMEKILLDFEEVSSTYIEKNLASKSFLIDIVDEYVNAAILSENKELVSYLLQYKRSHFSQDLVEQAEEDKWNLELGLRNYYPAEIHSTILLEDLAKANIKNDTSNLEVGDSIFIGNYPQGKMARTGELLWDVIDKNDESALLISHYAIDTVVYNKHLVPITWEESTIRQWLNLDFYNSTFSEVEKSLIVDNKLINSNNPEYNTPGGNDTIDKVFILSIDEVLKYYKDDKSRQAYPTSYAKDRRVTIGANDKCIWWLRTPGRFDYNATAVLDSGVIKTYGFYADYNLRAIRPVIRIRTK